MNLDIKGVFKPPVLSSAVALNKALRGERGFTEYSDEYRAKEIISADSINGILFPSELLTSSTTLYYYSLTRVQYS